MEEEKVDTSSMSSGRGRSVEEVKVDTSSRSVESEEESNLKTSLTSLDTSLRSVEERISELEAIVDGMMDYLEEVEVEEEIIVEPSSLPEETATTVMSSGRGETEKVEESTLGGKDENDSEKPIKQGKRQPTIWG